MLNPRKLTRKWKQKRLKMYLLLKMVIFQLAMLLYWRVRKQVANPLKYRPPFVDQVPSNINQSRDDFHQDIHSQVYPTKGCASVHPRTQQETLVNPIWLGKTTNQLRPFPHHLVGPRVNGHPGCSFAHQDMHQPVSKLLMFSYHKSPRLSSVSPGFCLFAELLNQDAMFRYNSSTKSPDV